MSRRRKSRTSPANSTATTGAPAAAAETDSLLAPRARSHDVAAAVVLALAAIVLGHVVFQLHRVPFYGVETDLLGEYIPVARDLLSGRLQLDALIARGPGYPLALGITSWATGGDFYLAARVVSFAGALMAAAFSYLLVADFLGGLAGLASLVLLLVTPVFVEFTVQAGGDMPTFALMMGAAWLACFCRGTRPALLAGLLAALAILSRPNALALVPAGAIALWPDPGRGRRYLAWGAALALPLAAWWGVLLARGVHPGAGARDALNMAYEFYGGQVGWEQYWRGTGQPFHGVLDVMRYAPGVFAAHYAQNLATRVWEDIHRLLPSWTGWLAVPGMVFSWGSRRRWLGVLAHFLFAYALLALVFYTPRFFLFLIPFYLAGTTGGLLALAAALTRHGRAGRRRIAAVFACGACVAFAVHAGLASARETSRWLGDAPIEALDAARELRAIGNPHQRVLARKPHVAYFAGMKDVPMPVFGPFPELFQQARAESADYLLVSPIEIQLQPRLAPLGDGLASLPGLTPVARGEPQPGHFYALYRFTGRTVSDSALADSVFEMLRAYASRRPGDGEALSLYGLELVGARRASEAVPVLTQATTLLPKDPWPARSLAVAYAELGRYDEAIAAASEEARREQDSSWAVGFIGEVCLEQHRYAEARVRLETALRLQPTNARAAAAYAQTCFAEGDWAAAAEAGERALRLTPEAEDLRELTATAWRAMGREDRARALESGHSP